MLRTRMEWSDLADIQQRKLMTWQAHELQFVKQSG